MLCANREFLERNPALLEHARNALADGTPAVRYYWVAADGQPARVTIETSDTERGRVATLQAVAEPPPWGLTVREHEVLTCVATGMTNPEIAEFLNCARRTVATHVEHILSKLGVRSRGTAAAYAMVEDALLAPLPPMVQPEITPVGRVTCARARAARAAVASGIVGKQAKEKRAIRLGGIYPMRGGRRLDALAMRRGAAMAIEMINERGGIGGRRVEHVIAEVTGDSADDLVPAVERLQAHDVDAITFGNVNPHHSLQAIRLAAQYRAPVLHGMVSPNIVEHVHDNPGTLGQTFQVCATETTYVSGFFRALDLLVRSGQWTPRNRRLAVVVRQASYEPYLNELERLGAAYGWEIHTCIPIDEVGTSWPDVVNAVERDDPAAVFVCSYIEAELRKFLEEMYRRRPLPLIYTVWTPSIPAFVSRMGGLAEGLLWSTVIGTYEDPISRQFHRDFARRFGEDPGSGSTAIHYDMVNMLAGAWSRLDRPWDFDGVVRSLRESVYRGVAGPYYFGGKGQRALAYPDDTRDASLAHVHLVHQIQDGRSRVIAPVEVAESSYRAIQDGVEGEPRLAPPSTTRT